MFGELPRVFNEVAEFFAPVKVVFKEEENEITHVPYRAQYVYVPKLDMKLFDYNLNNLMVIKDFYDYDDYPNEHVASLVMAHNAAILFLALKGTHDLQKSIILNSSMTCEELEKDISKINPYASLLLFKGYKQSRKLRKTISAEDIQHLPEHINAELKSLKIIDGPLIDFNKNFRKYCELRAKQGKQLKSNEQETLQLLDRYFDKENPKPGFQLNLYTERGIILV